MDAEGLDMAVCFPPVDCSSSDSISTEQIGPDGLEPEFATAIARAYNDWLKDFCDHAPDRMYGAGMVAAHDVDGAVAEARPLRGRTRLQVHLPPPAASTAAPGTTAPTTLSGPRSSAWACRCRSMAAARRT